MTLFSSRGPLSRGVLLAALVAWLGVAACATEIAGDEPPAGELHYPIGMALHPDGQILYLVNSNFNVAYRHGSVVALVLEPELTESRVLGALAGDPRDTRVLIDSFGGNIVVEDTPRTDPETGAPFYRAYVPVREGNAVVVVRIEETEVPTPGGGLRTVWGAMREERRVLTQRRDPFRVALGMQVHCPGEGEGRDAPLLAVEHLSLGELQFLDLDLLDRAIAGEELAASEEIIAGELDMSGGLVDMTVHPRTRELYVTSRFSNYIDAITPDPGALCPACKICEDVEEGLDCVLPAGCDEGWTWRSLVVSNSTGGGYDMRGLAFDPTGDRLFVGNRGPSSLLVVDTSDDEGDPRNAVIDALPLPAAPAAVHYLDRPDPARDLVLVTCFDAGELWIVDADTRLPLTATAVGYGPYELLATTLSVDGGDSRSVALITNFDDNNVAVVDLEDGPTFGEVITHLQ